MTGKIGPGAHAIAVRTNRIRRIEELECQVQDLTADVEVMERELTACEEIKDSIIAELRRQLELAKSDAIVERPMAQPGYAHHQGGTPCLDE